LQTMEVGAGAVPTDPDEEFLQFFRSLGIMDNSKVAFLARMLEAFYNMAIKLDEHLAPTRAVLHAAISRMCQGGSPMDAPQDRWIHIQDRLGFFSDGDDNGSQVINMGLAFACCEVDDVEWARCFTRHGVPRPAKARLISSRPPLPQRLPRHPQWRG